MAVISVCACCHTAPRCFPTVNFLSLGTTYSPSKTYESHLISWYFNSNSDSVFIYVHIKLDSLYIESNVIIRMIKSRRMRWAGHVARMKAKRNAYRILMGNSEKKWPLGRPRRRWVDNIKMDLREIGWDGMDWIDLAQDKDQWWALVNAVMHLRVA
jgi:hypothetical protein